ncbi:hypothetical protein ACWGJX_43920 [Streptomyces sp. NPDC054775]
MNSPSQLAHFFADFPVSWDSGRARSYEPRDSFGARTGRVSCVPSRRTMVTSDAGGRSYDGSSGAATYDCPFGPGH